MHLHDEMLHNPQPVFIVFSSFEKQLQQHQQYLHAHIDIWHFQFGADRLNSLIDWLIDWLLQLIMSNGGMVFLLIAYAIAIVSMTN